MPERYEKINGIECRDNGSSDGRTRGYAFLVYPESAAEDWLEYLESIHMPLFVSPLHAPEPDEKEEEERKPHYHVEIMGDGKLSFKQIVKIAERCGGTKYVMQLHSQRGYARYLIHRDNPKKIQYQPEDVIAMSGADYFKVCTEEEDKINIYHEICDWIDANNCSNYMKLLKYARHNMPMWDRLLACDTGYARTIKAYMRGLEREYEAKREIYEEQRINILHNLRDKLEKSGLAKDEIRDALTELMQNA